jgi:hypothetical protein
MSGRTGSLVAAALVALCVAILLVDYAVAARRAPGDDRLIKTLQQQTKEDATLAPKLAAEQKRVTAARLARKTRDDAVAWVLIAAAAAFLTFARRMVPQEKPSPRGAPAPPRAAVAAARLIPAAAPALDLTFVDQMVSQLGRSREAAIPLLQAIQAHYRYLPDEALRRLS